jgi:hypothetical protein
MFVLVYTHSWHGCKHSYCRCYYGVTKHVEGLESHKGQNLGKNLWPKIKIGMSLVAMRCSYAQPYLHVPNTSRLHNQVTSLHNEVVGVLRKEAADSYLQESCQFHLVNSSLLKIYITRYCCVYHMLRDYAICWKELMNICKCTKCNYSSKCFVA